MSMMFMSWFNILHIALCPANTWLNIIMMQITCTSFAHVGIPLGNMYSFGLFSIFIESDEFKFHCGSNNTCLVLGTYLFRTTLTKCILYLLQTIGIMVFLPKVLPRLMIIDMVVKSAEFLFLLSVLLYWKTCNQKLVLNEMS